MSLITKIFLFFINYYIVMALLIIRGPKEFIDEIVKNWESIKSCLESLEEKKEVRIVGRSGVLNVDAYLDLKEKIVISCDHPTLENIRPLINLVRAQLSVRRECKDLIGTIFLIHSTQVIKLAQVNKEIRNFVEGEYSEFMRRFLPYLILSLERTLSLEELNEEERGDLERVEDIGEPFRESVKNLSKLELYLAVVDNLWRRMFGWRPPDFVLRAGVDVNGLEEMFNVVLDALRAKDHLSARRAAYAITEFTFRIFGIDIGKMMSQEELRDNSSYHQLRDKTTYIT